VTWLETDVNIEFDGVGDLVNLDFATKVILNGSYVEVVMADQSVLTIYNGGRQECLDFLKELRNVIKAKRIVRPENKKPGADKIDYDFDNAKFTNVTEKDLARWQEAYPAVDVSREIKAAALWLNANPNNRKSNYKRFITNWLKRTQDRQPSGGKTLQQQREDQKRRSSCRHEGCALPGTVGPSNHILYCRWHYDNNDGSFSNTKEGFLEWWKLTGSRGFAPGTDPARVWALTKGGQDG
jgi:hypothetical protein